MTLKKKIHDFPEPWIFGTVALLGIAWHVHSMAPAAPSEAQQSERLINQCWDHVRSFPEKARQRAAAVCEEYEEEHRQKHGRYHTRSGKQP